MLIADYAVADAAGKVNVIGGGLTGLGRNPSTGLTPPFALFVSVSVPPHLYNAECSVEIILEDAGGTLVALPGLAPGLPPQPVRVGQAVRFSEPRFPQPVNAPARFLPARTQWAMSFSPGLPLAEGQGYMWRVKIDDEANEEWTERFVVLGNVAGPVLG
ncbi:MAG TPA: hypothetical protein VMV92_34735 [Streptosporangiaceae bacterium]|nr:hypothetical protein [Streptosporangiaceae bacterium]